MFHRGFQILENTFICFLVFGNPDETLALVFEVIFLTLGQLFVCFLVYLFVYFTCLRSVLNRYPICPVERVASEGVSDLSENLLLIFKACIHCFLKRGGTILKDVLY